jgi:predicted dehydrogenase
MKELLVGQGLVGYVGFQFRFHPGMRLIKQAIEEGRIGRPVSAHAHYGEYLPDWHPWEDYRLSYSARAELGGGVVLTLCHPFDYLRWLFGEVRGVFAQTGTLGDLSIEVEDTADILLDFESGVLGSVHLDYLQRPPSHRMEIIGTEATIRWDYEAGTTQIYDKGRKAWELHTLPAGYERNDLFKSEMENFLMAIAKRDPPVSTYADGVENLRIVLAALESASSNKVVDPHSIS